MLPAFPQRRNLVAPARHDNDPDEPDPEAKYVPGSKRKYNRIMLLRILLVELCTPHAHTDTTLTCIRTA